ncbi:MAG: nitroreductase family protein [Candidatus Pacearchaeota archaeon]|jgi:nitroreductase
MDFDKLLKTRASVKNYSDKEVKYDKIIDAIESANLAPSPGNLPILKYIIVEDKETIAQIAEACQQSFVETAPVLVIVCSDPQKAKLMYDKRTEKYVKQQAGAAIENFLLKITEMKLASCWVGAFSEVTAKGILGIPDDIDIEAILPIAYKTKADRTIQKPKIELGRIVFFEKYGNKFKGRNKKIGNE